jgi:vacuolar-type H+-ATPase subunit I/STV1
MLARAAHRRHGYVETKLKERVASLEKKVDLKARNKLSRQVGSLEASIAKHKALVEDAEACLSRNVDLNAELKRKDEELRKAEDSRKKAEELAEENAKKLEGFRAALLACMQEAKVAINTAFVKGGMESSGVLPEADPAAF